MSSQENEPVNQDAEADKKMAELNAKRQHSQPILQAMAQFADEGKIREYFAAYQDLMKGWSPKELVDQGQYLPPWYIPGADIQLIMIHTQLALIHRILADANVFTAAIMAQKAKSASGLVSADGRPILGGG